MFVKSYMDDNNDKNQWMKNYPDIELLEKGMKNK